MSSQITDPEKRKEAERLLLELWDLMELSDPPRIAVRSHDMRGYHIRLQTYTVLGEILLGKDYPEREIRN